MISMISKTKTRKFLTEQNFHDPVHNEQTLPEQQSNNREILSLFRPSWTKWSRREGIKCESLCV